MKGRVLLNTCGNSYPSEGMLYARGTWW